MAASPRCGALRLSWPPRSQVQKLFPQSSAWACASWSDEFRYSEREIAPCWQTRFADQKKSRTTLPSSRAHPRSLRPSTPSVHRAGPTIHPRMIRAHTLCVPRRLDAALRTTLFWSLIRACSGIPRTPFGLPPALGPTRRSAPKTKSFSFAPAVKVAVAQSRSTQPVTAISIHTYRRLLCSAQGTPREADDLEVATRHVPVDLVLRRLQIKQLHVLAVYPQLGDPKLGREQTQEECQHPVAEDVAGKELTVV